jgi:hypothetical protein
MSPVGAKVLRPEEFRVSWSVATEQAEPLPSSRCAVGPMLAPE